MSASDDSRKNFSPLQMLGWLTGGLSLLNLIEELNPMKIYGNLKKWLDAYTSFVEKVGNFLFGWIEFGWVQVSDLEMHVLVIATILLAAYYRASFRVKRANGLSLMVSFGISFSVGFVLFCLVLLPTLLLPTWFGLFGGAIILFFICSAFFARPDKLGLREEEFLELDMDRLPPQGEILYEVIGVAAIFFFLIALNYTVFKHWF